MYVRVKNQHKRQLSNVFLYIKDEIVIGDSTFPQLKTQVKKKLLLFKNTIF